MYKIMYGLLVVLIVLIVGCNRYPDIDEPGACEKYGVVESNAPLGEILSINELSSVEVSTICGPTGWVDRVHSGCVIQNEEKTTVTVYYRMGDTCVKNHEICHAKHGKKHTQQYNSDLMNRHPAPACPSIL